MTNNPIQPRDIPRWFLETARIMGETEQMVRDIDTGLRYAMRLNGLDSRLRDDLQYVRDALGTVKVSLSVIDVTAKRVLSDLTKP